jgi:PEP-CTERM motif
MFSARFLAPALFVLSSLTVPVASFADSSVDYSNAGGTLTGSNSGFSLSDSTLIAVIGPSGMVTGDLGTVGFTTGALTSGNLQTGGILAAGGTFDITGNGSNGVPNGTLFSGSFSGPVTWAMTTLGNGTHNYTLTGAIAGNSQAVAGVTVQLTINTGMGFFNGSTGIAGGDTTIVGSVPEPSTVAMFGTGVVALLGLVRRKLQA